MAENKVYPLNQIYFYLTEGCNLKCRHCWISPKYQTEGHVYPSLDFDLFRSIIKQATPIGLQRVKLTGGEPLLHPRIHDMLDFIRSEDLALTMETNGLLCTKEIALRINGCNNPSISVSLDGANALTHEWIRGVEGCFKSAIDSIHNLVEAGIRPKVIMTIMRRNMDQISNIVRLAESLGAGSIKFNMVQPTARGEEMQRTGETLSVEEYIKLGQWVENKLSNQTNLPLSYDHPLAFRLLGRIFGEKGDGCSTCGILGIIGVLANGSYALCGIGQTISKLTFGHAADVSLEDVWKGSPVLKEIRDGLPGRFKGICGECVMLSRCLGSCLAQNYYSARDFWAPYWYCDMAKRKGLFPETRIRPS
jgi:SynChlorMet cassette radical SAM/SPASM protein ScmF